jgi:membrane-associated phospholipid phosphatase
VKRNRRSQKLVPTPVGRLGVLTRQPLVWITATAVMAAAGGAKGRWAALRGSVCYLLAAAAGNHPKPLVGRAQPRHRWPRKPQVVRGAFPSGHASAEVAYVFGASLEAPATFLPLGAMALIAHMSLVRAGKHYISDTLVGGTIGLGVVALTAVAWRPRSGVIRPLRAGSVERARPISAVIPDASG